MIQIIENFFDNFNLLEPNFKKIKLYNVNDFNKNFRTNQNWPGYRSNFLQEENIFLQQLFVKEFRSKVNFKDNFKLNLHIHLRLKSDQDKDFIHRDSLNKYGCIVYLNNNIDSGTNFYDSNLDVPLVTVKSIKNRLVFFDSKIRHGSILNFGNDINDGRLTLNGFLD